MLIFKKDSRSYDIEQIVVNQILPRHQNQYINPSTSLPLFLVAISFSLF